MLVLGIDTSSSFLGVALSDTNGLKTEIHEDGGLTHSERLLPRINDLFRESGRNIKQVEKIVVTIGPGSFTGIRIGVATANAFGLGLGICVVGVSTLEAMAYCVNDYEGLIIATMDAQRGSFYSLFGKFEDGKLVKLEEEAVSSKEEIIEYASAYDKVIVLGDALKSWEDMPKNFEKSNIYSPKPLVLCEIGRNRIAKSDFAEPVYIRKSQAEVEYDQRNSK